MLARGVRDLFRRQNLQRDVPAQVAVDRFVNHSHAAFAQLAGVLEVRDMFANYSG